MITATKPVLSGIPVDLVEMSLEDMAENRDAKDLLSRVLNPRVKRCRAFNSSLPPQEEYS
jgi:hypothetical protein